MSAEKLSMTPALAMGALGRLLLLVDAPGTVSQKHQDAQALLTIVALGFGSDVARTRQFLAADAHRTQAIAAGLRQLPEAVLGIEVEYDAERYSEVVRTFRSFGHDVSVAAEIRSAVHRTDPDLRPTEPPFTTGR